MALAVASVTHTAFTTDTTAHLAAMPATVNAGDLLIIFASSDGSATITTPSGWTLIYGTVQSTTNRGTAYCKIAAGTEGGTTLDLVTSAAEQMAVQVYRITGNIALVGAGYVEGGTALASGNAGVATIDPPAVTPSWGAGFDTLFITAANTSSAATVVSQPSGWGAPTKTNEGGSGQAAASANLFTSVLSSTASPVDPGVWTMSATSTTSVSNTIAIRPQIGTIGLPANTLAGATVSATTQALSIPVVAAGRILLITSHARRASTTLAPDDPTLADSSAAPLIWTPVFSPIPSIVGVNPGTKAQWWWAVADGAAKTVTLTWLNASAIWASVADFSIGAGFTPNFVNQVWAANSGTPATVTATYPVTPVSGINFLSFYGAGGSTSTIATGYLSLTFVASTPYRTGYDPTPGVNAVMGSSFLDQILAAVNITDALSGPQGAKAKVWSGSAWVEKPMARWSGSAWVQEAPKVWSGTAWVSSAMPPWTPPAMGPTASLLTSFTPGTYRNDFTGEVGVRLNMTASRTVSWIGMRCGSGNTGIHKVNIYEWFTDALVATANIDLTGKTEGTFYWTAIAPVTLTSGYYGVLAEVVQGDGQWWSDNAYTAFSATYTGNIYATYRQPSGGMQVTGIDMQFVGVDLGW